MNGCGYGVVENKTQTGFGMRRRMALVPMLALVLSGLAVPAYAACPAWFPPLDHVIVPDDNAPVFVTYSESDRVETLVLLPEFSGTAAEFGMVLPLPGRPEINEAPEEMFDFLAEYTNRVFFERSPAFDSMAEGFAVSESSVVVIEQKDVGDFETTLLTASNAQDLVDWLNDRDFQFTEEDEDNFDYYVQKGGYYFVAMKVNMDEASIDESGGIDGELRPIEFVFPSEHPMLPLRIMSHDMDPMDFTLYTMTEFPYYIPGVDVIYSEKVGWRNYGEFWQLDRYDPFDKWFVRMNVEFDPRTIETNLLLQRADKLDNTNALDYIFRINPDQLPSAGVIGGDAESNLFLGAFADAMTPREQTEHGIPPESIECDHPLKLMLRSDGQNTACVLPTSVSTLTERGWQVSTMRADELERLS